MAEENKNQQNQKIDLNDAILFHKIGRFPVDNVPQELIDMYHITPEMLKEIEPGMESTFTIQQVNVGVRKGYLLRKVGDAYMVMPTGPRMKEYRGMITLNETGAFLFKEAQKPDASRRSLIDAAMAEYKVGEPEAAENVDSFIQQCAECRLFAQINHEIVIYNDPQGESEEALKE